MENNKKGFWRSFTARKFLLFSIYWFAMTLVVSIIIDYFDPESLMADNFTMSNLIKRAVGSLVAGFLFAVWIEPTVKNKR
jgi:hypothetical protein